jgi:hypothetical protein
MDLTRDGIFNRIPAMSSEACNHPNSDINFFRRLNLDLQSQRILRAIRSGKILMELDDIDINTKISMAPRRKKVRLPSLQSNISNIEMLHFEE